MSARGDNIFISCRKGDLPRVKFLVEEQDVELNVRDFWDSTPLYYACHSGHVEIVKYLLANGANCQRNTFDGERCLYGALTQEIKNILLDSKIADMETQKRDDFDVFCESLLSADEFSDFTLHLGNKQFKLHRCIMAARSPGFNSLLSGKWRDLNQVSNSLIEPEAFEEFVKFLYTGKLKCTRDQFEDIKRIANRCQVEYLVKELEQVMLQSTAFEMSKRNIKVTTLVVDTPVTRHMLLQNFNWLIESGMEKDYVRGGFVSDFYKSKSDHGVLEAASKREADVLLQPFFDVCLKVEGAQFFCNKLLLCTRCPYFTALLQDYFNEHDKTSSTMAVVNLKDVSAPVLSCVLHFIYTNSPRSLRDDVVLQVLEIANMYLLPGLVKSCGFHLHKLIDFSNVVDFVRIARLHSLARLEDRCAKFIADNITLFVIHNKFAELVKEDIQVLKHREEIDSIFIIDDIRLHIRNAPSRDYVKVLEKLRLIDEMLMQKFDVIA